MKFWATQAGCEGPWVLPEGDNKAGERAGVMNCEEWPKALGLSSLEKRVWEMTSLLSTAS